MLRNRTINQAHTLPRPSFGKNNKTMITRTMTMETVTIIMTAQAEWQLDTSDILKIAKMDMAAEEGVEPMLTIPPKIIRPIPQAMAMEITTNTKQRRQRL